MTIPTGTFFGGPGNAPTKKHFKTIGYAEIMGMELKTIEQKLRRLRGKKLEAFVSEMSKAEDKAIEIRHKWLKRVQANPFHFFKGWDFVRYEHMVDGSYQFWFEPSKECEYSI